MFATDTTQGQDPVGKDEGSLSYHRTAEHAEVPDSIDDTQPSRDGTDASTPLKADLPPMKYPTCGPCQKRRIACSRDQPACTNCRRYRIECTQDDQFPVLKAVLHYRHVHRSETVRTVRSILEGGGNVTEISATSEAIAQAMIKADSPYPHLPSAFDYRNVIIEITWGLSLGLPVMDVARVGSLDQIVRLLHCAWFSEVELSRVCARPKS
jgi:hypothetical protein